MPMAVRYGAIGCVPYAWDGRDLQPGAKPEMVRLLLDSGATLMAVDSHNRSALDIAVFSDNEPCRHVIEVGVKPSPITAHGTRVHHAFGGTGQVEMLARRADRGKKFDVKLVPAMPWPSQTCSHSMAQPLCG